jgi:hypothetical protein
MAAPESIVKLCETFELRKEHYKSGGYNETDLRREFLDPFFKVLGWDVDMGSLLLGSHGCGANAFMPSLR